MAEIGLRSVIKALFEKANGSNKKSVGLQSRCPPIGSTEKLGFSFYLCLSLFKFCFFTITHVPLGF